jgi:hypothetical protein
MFDFVVRVCHSVPCVSQSISYDTLPVYADILLEWAVWTGTTTRVSYDCGVSSVVMAV